MGYTPNTWHPMDVITSKKLNDLEQGLTQTSDNVVYGMGGATQSSDGIHSLIYIEKGDPLPSNPQVGDTIYMKDGNDFSILEWDGEQWNTRIDPKLSERIQTALDTAKADAADQISKNNDEIKSTIDEVAQEKVDLAIKDADFNTQAQAMADKALSDAKANTATVAQDTLDSANDNIAQAKSDITDAYKNADSVISKKVDDTATSINTTISQNKKDADDKITSTQSSVSQALDEISQKVSQTDYDAKTGDLDKRITTAQTTADGAVTTVGNYKTSNDNRVSAAETKISQNASDITLRATTSDLNAAKSDYNAQIAQVKVDAGKVETTVSNLSNKVNNLGQINQLFNTEFSPDFAGWSADTGYELSSGLPTYDGSNVVHIKTTNTGYDYLRQKIPVVPGQVLSFSTMMKFAPTSPDNSTVYWRYSINFYKSSGGSSLGITYGTINYQTLDWALQKSENIVAPADTAYVTINYYMRGAGEAWLAKPMIVFSQTVGDYVQGNYNNNDKVASQQVTIDGITDTVSKQGTNIDSVTQRVTTAEGTLTTATNNITGLQTQQTTTSNQVTQEISDRKTGDNNTLQSSKDFTTSSITSAVNGVNSTITQTSNAILAQVGATNLFPNSEFEKDYGYRTKDSKTVLSLATKNNIDGAYNGTVSVTSTGTSYEGYWANNIQVQGGQKYSASVKVHYTNGSLTAGKAQLDLWFIDSTGARISSQSVSTSQVSSPYWVQLSVEGFTAPTNAVYLQMSLIVNNAGAGQVATFTQPMLTATSKLQPYTPNDDISSQMSLFKDNWSIGIKDNQSALTSGLFGDINGMTLNGKVVTIDANTTNITGKTWINSAMIANAAIQTVNIADAAITNAKIATLDVAKITGDVSTFIQSNWNGQFGSTTIDSTGMQVVTGKAKTKFGDGSMSIISSLGENIGWIGRQVDSVYTNLDYLTFGLNGWHTTTPGDDNYDDKGTNTDQYYGGDGIIFGISTIGGGYLPLLQWNSDLAAGYRGGRRGWMFTQPIVAGLTVYTENSNNDANGIIMQPGWINSTYYPTLTSISSGGSTGYAIGQGASYMYAGNNRILRADSNGYLYYQTTKTGSSGKSLLMASDGAIIAQSSATKYKTDIRYEKDTSFGDRLLTIDPATWADKNEAEQIAEFNETGKKPDYAMNKDGARYYGLIAEDMIKAGLEELVVRDTITGAVEGIQYEKVGAALIPLLREQRNQINELKVEIERLKVKTSE